MGPVNKSSIQHHFFKLTSNEELKEGIESKFFKCTLMIKVERVLTQSLNAQEWGNVKRALIEIKKHDVKEQSWVKKAWALLGLNIHLFALKWLPRHKVSAPLIFKKNKETIEALLRIPPDKQTVQIEITRFKDLIEKLFLRIRLSHNLGFSPDFWV